MSSNTLSLAAWHAMRAVSLRPLVGRYAASQSPAAYTARLYHRIYILQQSANYHLTSPLHVIQCSYSSNKHDDNQ